MSFELLFQNKINRGRFLFGKNVHIEYFLVSLGSGIAFLANVDLENQPSKSFGHEATIGSLEVGCYLSEIVWLREM